MPEDVRRFLLDVTGGHSPFTVRVGSSVVYAPDAPAGDVGAWLGFVEQIQGRMRLEEELIRADEQRQHKERVQREQFNRFILACLEGTDEELYARGDDFPSHRPAGLTVEEEDRASRVERRLRGLIEQAARRLSLEHERWIEQHGSPFLRDLLKSHADRWWVNMIDFVPEGYSLMERDARLVPMEVMDVFMYELACHLHPGWYHLPSNTTFEVGEGVPEHLFEQARQLGGTLQVMGDHQGIEFPPYVSEEERDRLNFLRFVVVKPWLASHVVFPLEPLTSRAQVIQVR